MSWTNDTENMLTSWMHTAHDYKILYDLSAQRSERINQIFGIPLIILGALTTSAIFLDFENCEFWPQLITGLLSFVLTVLTAVGKFLDYDSIQHNFKTASENWEDIELDIQIQLARSRLERIPADDFINTIRTARNKLQSIGLSVPNAVFKDYINTIDRYFDSLGINQNDDNYSYVETPMQQTRTPILSASSMIREKYNNRIINTPELLRRSPITMMRKVKRRRSPLQVRRIPELQRDEIGEKIPPMSSDETILQRTQDKKIPEDVTTQVPQDVTTQVPQDVTIQDKKIPQDVTTQVPQDVTIQDKKIPQDVTTQDKKIPQDVTTQDKKISISDKKRKSERKSESLRVISKIPTFLGKNNFIKNEDDKFTKKMNKMMDQRRIQFRDYKSSLC